MRTAKPIERRETLNVAPLISVIVPIYNVERYVRKCLDSLVNQTMKQIEVICIDDGSTDNSGKIAEEYESSEFPIFRVIHTENRGLSASRNSGLGEARAEWIMFVDSDDWVDERFCEIPWKAKEEYGADLVCFDFYRVTRWGRVKKPRKTNAPTGILDKMTAHEFGGFATWNKLYKRTLFSEIRFPEGHVHEDLATAHRFVDKADRIVLLPNCLYYYIDRKGGISHTYTDTNRRDGFVFALGRYEFLMNHGYISGKIEWLLQKNAIRYLGSTRLSQDVEYVKAREILERIHGIPKGFTTKQKIAYIAWKIDKRLFYFICKISGRLRE